VAVDYDGAFAEVVLSRWNETSDEQKRAAQSSDRKGQLKPDDPESFALYDTYCYQRGHADVFREVYKKAHSFPSRKSERLLVVDIGAGAATVAVALSEALGRSKRERVEYRGFDPHPMMRKLGKQMLKQLCIDFRSAKYVTSLDTLEFARNDRVLFTFSYVAHQGAVALADIEEWSRLIRRAVNDVDRAVELIYTTIGSTPASLPENAFLKLKRMLKTASVRKKQRPIDVQVPQRFPVLGGHSPMCWDDKSRLWYIRAEHWILRK